MRPFKHFRPHRPALLTAVVVTLFAVSIIFWGHSAAAMNGGVDVVNTTCEDGNITAVTAAVTYHADRSTTVTAHVWSSKQHVQHSWSPQRIEIESGRTQIRFEPRSNRGYIRGDQAQIAINDGQRRAIENWRVSCEV